MADNQSKKILRLADYVDFRLYLKDLISDLADHEPKGTGRTPLHSFAKSLGLSRSHLAMVLSGERGLSLSSIHDIARALRFKHSDHERWEAMVLYGQAKSEYERDYYLSKLDSEKNQRVTSAINTPSRALIAEWYVPALLVYLIDISKEEADLVKIATKLQVDQSTLQTTIESLQEQGFLSFSHGGSVHISFNRLTTLVSNKRFLRKVFDEGLRQMNSHFTAEHFFYHGTTFSVAQVDIHKFIADYKALIDRYVTATLGEGTKRVVQANMQFFPVL